MAEDKKKAGSKGATKAAARKVKDKWKAKEWYKIHAPRMFNQTQLGETPSSDPASIMGRTVEATVHDLTGDFSKMHIKMKFRVSEVRGFDAHTMFTGMDLTSDYIRRMTRRKRTKTDHVVDVRLKDGYVVRVKPMSITEKRIQAAQETDIRNNMSRELQAMGQEMGISELVRSIISGEMAQRLSNACKVVIPVKRVEVRKVEVIEMGEGGQDTPIIEVVPDEPAPEAAAEGAPEAAAAAPEAPAEEEIQPEAEKQ
jgi:small subunit ribosomal protein S3Ae